MDEEKKDILDFFFDGDIIIAGAQGYTNISKIQETGSGGTPGPGGAY